MPSNATETRISSETFLNLITAAKQGLEFYQKNAVEYPSSDNYWNKRVAETEAAIQLAWDIRHPSLAAKREG